MAQRNNYMQVTTGSANLRDGRNSSPGSKPPKSAENQYADQIYKRIMDNQGNLINDPQIHIVVAVLNIDVNDLIDR